MERPTMDHSEALQSEACEKYLLGELPQAQRDAYEEHYFSCAECAAQLLSAARFLGASRELFAARPAPRVIAALRNPLRNPWFAWFRPVLALPAFALLLLVVGYQNLVTIPQYREASTSRVLAMHSLILANTRGEEGVHFTVSAGEPFGLYVDIPTDAAHSRYLLRLQDPSGNSAVLRSVTSDEARKTQVVVVNPVRRAGKYTLVVSGVADGSAKATSGDELARLEFTVAVTN
jgi:hypothetical protein